MRHEGADPYRLVRQLRARLLDVRERHGADAALVLRHDQVGTQPLEHLGPHVVDARPLPDQIPNRAVDVPAWLGRVDPGLGADRQPSHILGKVALVRDAHQAVS